MNQSRRKPVGKSEQAQQAPTKQKAMSKPLKSVVEDIYPV